MGRGWIPAFAGMRWVRRNGGGAVLLEAVLNLLSPYLTLFPDDVS